VPGGVRSPLTEEGRARIRAWLPEAFATTKVAFDLFKKTLEETPARNPDLRQFPVAVHGPGRARRHLGAPRRQAALHRQQRQHHRRPARPAKVPEFIGESVQTSSYLKSPYYKPLGFPDGMYRVGPLARLNVCERWACPRRTPN
jgi:NAD-reducing hydrogenase large subunit